MLCREGLPSEKAGYMGATHVNTGFLFAKAEGAIYGLRHEAQHFHVVRVHHVGLDQPDLRELNQLSLRA